MRKPKSSTSPEIGFDPETFAVALVYLFGEDDLLSGDPRRIRNSKWLKAREKPKCKRLLSRMWWQIEKASIQPCAKS